MSEEITISNLYPEDPKSVLPDSKHTNIGNMFDRVLAQENKYGRNFTAMRLLWSSLAYLKKQEHDPFFQKFASIGTNLMNDGRVVASVMVSGSDVPAIVSGTTPQMMAYNTDQMVFPIMTRLFGTIDKPIPMGILEGLIDCDSSFMVSVGQIEDVKEQCFLGISIEINDLAKEDPAKALLHMITGIASSMAYVYKGMIISKMKGQFVDGVIHRFQNNMLIPDGLEQIDQDLEKMLDIFATSKTPKWN